MSAVESMIGKLQAGVTPSRDLDREIAVLFGKTNDFGVVTCAGYLGIADFTSDLGAAVRLCRDVLPGWFWRCGSTSLFPNGWAHVSRFHADHCDRKDEAASADGKAATPAIALCIAIMKAKLANPEPLPREERP